MKESDVKAQVAEEVKAEVKAEVKTNINGRDMTVADIRKSLIKQGCNEIKDILVKNVNFKDMGDHVRLTFTLNQTIPAFITTEDDNGDSIRVLDKSNILFTSTYAIGGMLKDNAIAAHAANDLVSNPTAMCTILSYGRVDILQQRVKANEPYVNPFSTKKDIAPEVYDEDKLINHIVNVELSDRAIQILDALALEKVKKAMGL